MGNTIRGRERYIRSSERQPTAKLETIPEPGERREIFDQWLPRFEGEKKASENT
ncbi:hypothetical protein SAMN04515672_3280 [Natronorubrum texcoconense]|uniref:Uncharacterized protein n=1 Tax=Natronorubrum texcoconense TaxID=1095776 RepID=A0A1G9CRF3_9EURY|nr:hypothetical protein SAMN04515672_3280 [Natronorubrum texcoconense]